MAVEPDTSIIVRVHWSNFALMLPENISPGELEEIEDPVDRAGLATGTSRIYIHCLADNGDGTCTERQFYEERITMRAARLEIRGAIMGKTSADPFLQLRQPIGQDDSLGVGYHFAQNWITVED